MSQFYQFSSRSSARQLVYALEEELTQLITVVKKLGYSKKIEHRGQLSLVCERVERLLELLSQSSVEQLQAAEIKQSTVDYVRIEAHALLAKAKTLSAVSLCVGQVDGNVVHLKRDDVKAEQDAYAHMLAALDIDTLLLESEQALGEDSKDKDERPVLSLVHSSD